MAAILRDSVVIAVAVVMRTRPRAIPLAMITMRKSIHGFPFLFYMGMGLRYYAWLFYSSFYGDRQSALLTTGLIFMIFSFRQFLVRDAVNHQFYNLGYIQCLECLIFKFARKPWCEVTISNQLCTAAGDPIRYFSVFMLKFIRH